MIHNSLKYATESMRLTRRSLDFVSAVLKYENFVETNTDHRLSKGLTNLFQNIKKDSFEFINKLASKLDQMRVSGFDQNKHTQEELYGYFLKELDPFKDRISFLESRWQSYLEMAFEGNTIPNEYKIANFVKTSDLNTNTPKTSDPTENERLARLRKVAIGINDIKNGTDDAGKVIPLPFTRKRNN